MKQKYISYFLLSLLITALAACGTAEKRPMKPELAPDSAPARAVKRWQAMIQRDFTTAYPLYTPGFRSKTPLLQFVDNFPGGRVVWNDVEYLDHQCEAAKCTVRLDVTYSLLNPAPGVDSVVNKRTVDETWLLIDGVWYYSP